MGGGFGLGLFIFAIAALIFFLIFRKSDNNVPGLSYSDFLNQIENGKVVSVRIIDGVKIMGKYRGETGDISFKSVIPYDDTTLMPLLQKKGVQIIGETSSPGLISRLAGFLPIIFMFVLILMMMRQNAIQSDNGMKFGQSNARRYDPKKKKVTFEDVAGHAEPKKELFEVVDFLKHPKKYTDLGAKIPKGVLLVGDPGTGKTLLARAVAGEAGVEFLHISGSDFVEMFVGVGASRVRDLFSEGRRLAPCIIFIDEIDAVGRARGAGFGGGHDEREQTLNQLLVEMDGFDPKDGVIVLAATNRPDVLDPALLRPGRFDRQVVVPLPDIKEREQILCVHAKTVKMEEDVDLNRIARATPGMSGADLAGLINEGALFSARANKKRVGMEELELARDKLLMGVERKSMVMNPKEREMTAFHEAGHALLYYFMENATPLHKVSIIPHGRALGVTVGLPEHDSYSHTKSYLLDQISIILGGYGAETIIYNDTTTGTQNDLHRATDIARKMVCEWGMDEEIGSIAFGQEDEPIFMGKEIARHKSYSEFSAKNIDVAVKKILDNARNRSIQLLRENRDKLEKLANTLLEKETLSDGEIRLLLNFPLKEVTA
ncbi:MAG: ATP-dependent zinc metalloprotease FtsH [Spirochaetaceae bacterium]|nr:ATP-dependent zinc metalloprotease FtsH [Spirochaetaceae bacterium]